MAYLDSGDPGRDQAAMVTRDIVRGSTATVITNTRANNV